MGIFWALAKEFNLSYHNKETIYVLQSSIGNVNKTALTRTQVGGSPVNEAIADGLESLNRLQLKQSA